MRSFGRLVALVLMTFGAAAVASAAPAGAAAAGATGNISVVHGLRGVVADVSVDGRVALQGFAPERLACPIPLPAGAHDIAVSESGAAAGSPPILSDSITIAPGGSVTAVAHLGAQGQPNLTVFTDDLTPLPAGQSRLVVRHTAQVDGVRIVLDDVPLGSPIESAGEEAIALPAGAHDVQVQTADGRTVMLPAQAVTTKAGQATVIYLIGSAQGDDLGWLVQEIAGLGGAPTGVPTGNSGLAAPARSAIAPGFADLSVVGALALLAILAAGARTLRRREPAATSPAAMSPAAMLPAPMSPVAVSVASSRVPSSGVAASCIASSQA